MSGTLSDLFDGTSDDGFGGMDPQLYDFIVQYKKDNTYPPFIAAQQKNNRNGYFHWRQRCTRFGLSEADTLLYYEQPTKGKTPRSRVVVKRGEVAHAIKVIHERSGHSCIKITQARISRRLYWKSIHRDVTMYIERCEFCKEKKCMARAVKPLKKEELDEMDKELLTQMSLMRSLEDFNMVDRLFLSMEDYKNETFSLVEVDDLGDPYEEVVLSDMPNDMMTDETVFDGHQDCPENYDKYPQSQLTSMLVGNKVDEMSSNLRNHGAVNNINETRPLTLTATMNHPSASSADNTSSGLVEEVDDSLSVGDHLRDQLRRHRDRDDSYQCGKRRRMSAASNRLSQEPISYIEHSGQPVQYVDEFGQHVEQYPFDPRSNLGPMIFAPADAEAVRMQKNVLKLQEDVLLLKKQYMLEKMAKLRGTTVNDVSLFIP